jgi:molybdenum cofactor cytidylyltransferase
MVQDRGSHVKDSKVGGVLLAAGMSRRLAGRNKLVEIVGGQPVVRRTVGAYLAGGLDPVVVVVGYEAERVAGALAGLSIQIVSNPDYAEGQSRSLLWGLGALGPRVEAAVIGVGDQPLLRGEIVTDLVAAFRSGARLAVPRYVGRRGNPVLFARSLFEELTRVEGDQGGRPVIEAHRDEIVWIDVADAEAGADVDTLEDLDRLSRFG